MKAAIYARVSTEEQAKEGYSIDAQISTLKSYAKMCNYDIYKTYKDEGLSGKDTARPGLNEMIKDAYQNKFDVLLIWKISRLSRNLKNLLTIVDALDKYGVGFISQSETFNTSTPVGKMTLQMLGSIAEFERNTIIENVKLGLCEKAKRGEWLGGRVLGYKSVNKELKVDSSKAKIIKIIFKLFNADYTIYQIARFLNSKDYNTINNKKFTQASVYRILTNPIYIGNIRFNNILYKGIHKPIIDAGLFEKVQGKLEKKTREYGENDFVLSGLIICPLCGSRLIRYKSSKYRYYRCGGYHNYGKTRCKGFLINADFVENEVYLQLKDILKMSGNIQTIYDILKIEQVFKKDFIEKINELEYSIQKDIIRLLVKEIKVNAGKRVTKVIYYK